MEVMRKAQALAANVSNSTQDTNVAVRDGGLKKDPWEIIRTEECDVCQRHRRTRKRVLDATATSFGKEFATARLITPNNRPRYYAAQHRAVLYARFKRMQVLWVQADDFRSPDKSQL